MARWRLSETRYPAVRRVMGPDRLVLDDPGIEAVIEEALPGAHPEDVENFARDFQRFGRILERDGMPVAMQALQGSREGSAFGPYGAIIGAAAGAGQGIVSAATRSQQTGRASGPAPGAGSRPGLRQPRQAPPEPPVAPAQVTAPAALAAANCLILICSRQTIQSLLAIMLGEQGSPSVDLNGRRMPPAAFASALAEMASLAAEGAPEGDAGHLLDETGHPRGDLPNPVERARLLVDAFWDAAEAADWTEDAAEAAAEDAAHEDDMGDEYWEVWSKHA